MLVRLPDIGYTPSMHRIDRKWIELSSGYRDIQSYKTKLEVEFGRAVRVGHNLQFRKELTEWQKKRRLFFALAAVAPLTILALCLTSYYFRDVACVIIYWALLVVIILITLAIAGRQYLREMMKGKPTPVSDGAHVVDLEERWWDSLSPQDLSDEKVAKKGGSDLQSMLAHSLPDSYIFQSLSATDLLLLGPSGIWIFIIMDWSGVIFKEGGIWTETVTVHDKLGRRQHEQKTHESGPDDQWLQRKQEIVKKVETNIPHRAWTLNLIQGGVVFSNPKGTLDKKRIRGNAASYGVPRAWAERIHRAPPLDDFTPEKQLEFLDILAETEDAQTVSAKDEADRLYRLAVEELRGYIAKLVK